MSKPSKLLIEDGYFGEVGLSNMKDFVLEVKSSDRLLYVDPNTGVQLVMLGSDFKVEGNIIVKGTINSWSRSLDGNVGDTFSRLNIDAAKLSHTSMDEFVNDLYSTFFKTDNLFIIRDFSPTATGLNLGDGNDTARTGDAPDEVAGGKGNDTIFSQGGDDTLLGEQGRDRLTGGAGSDIFAFKNGDGKDTVTDFDAIGGEGNQDFIGASYSEVTVRGHGRNTIIDFGGGDTLTLLDVRVRDIDASDFKDFDF